MTALHQVLPCYARWDAIGNHVLRLQALLRSKGVESDVFARIHDNAPGPVRPASELSRLPGNDALLYHLSTGSGLAETVRARPERLAVDYHNVSPHEVFARWEPTIGPELALGRAQLELLAPRAELAVADSSFNAAECELAGYRSITVAPILLDLGTPSDEIDETVRSQLLDRKASESGADWLFVSRVAPHKAHHDVIAAFAAFRHAYDPHARLTFIGGSSSDAYWRTLERTIAALGLTHDVRLLGSVAQGVLNAHYATADVFVCLSDHEGFGIPVLEAMSHRVPVVAFAAGAVPETVAGGSILLPRKEPALVAAAVHRVTSDPVLAARLVDAGTARVGDFALERTGKIMLDALAPLLP